MSIEYKIPIIFEDEGELAKEIPIVFKEIEHDVSRQICLRELVESGAIPIEENTKGEASSLFYSIWVRQLNNEVVPKFH